MKGSKTGSLRGNDDEIKEMKEGKEGKIKERKEEVKEIDVREEIYQRLENWILTRVTL